MRNPIGFSTGVLYRTVDSVSVEIVNICRSLGCEAIEVNCHNHPEHTDKMEKGDFWEVLKGSEFKHFSVHMPCNIRINDWGGGYLAIQKIMTSCLIRYPADYFLVHPDLVDRWRVINELACLSLVIENMDHRKKSFRYPEELRSFFDAHPEFGFVLDVNHWAVNDLPVNGIGEIIAEFSNRLVGVHLSGVSDDNYHAPIHKTDQYWLVEQLYNLPPNVPIILEGVCEDVDEMRAELQYVRRSLTDY